MTHRSAAFAAFAALLLLGAAMPATAQVLSAITLTLGTAGDAEKRAISYECDTLEPFTVDYVNAAPNFLALVPVEGETVIFASVISGSGARYAAGRLEWWTAGAEATLYDRTLDEAAQAVATCLEITMTP